MATTPEKADLRNGRLAARDAIPEEERLEKNLSLTTHGLGAVHVSAHMIVSGFLPIRSEVDLKPLMAALAQEGARLCLPAILDRTTIVFREYRPDAELISMGFGTYGPAAHEPVLDPQIMLVPLAAFDRSGNRIGYGGGYYDRAIHLMRQKGGNPKLIGIAFDCQEVASVPVEPHDIRLDAILTESGYRPFA
ncbi:5-formyltetrahydrofolate cyclo-ligase [Rhizobiales bacterium RZME27]|jgi:5-formyltetrahydrofolate cyclo-ligase|uniref:5-formyltetrahydrofolate cyclo-ligase n=1 Tax=Endobacterium cereale TaxID=2663029 RepID=A0A6A8AJK2_9HYPH|nr:5-formyltetrahydrofolate cyclo-ligase [Endobacterium cereale]MEB2845761.1 5-formyltetrahydrofolate cyclo-ligase [Endobacterium cereale]MQY50067.1 5-formyltetrahydrofolate cyclo-ligase [Endobacterium cereale]